MAKVDDLFYANITFSEVFRALINHQELGGDITIDNCGTF